MFLMLPRQSSPSAFVYNYLSIYCICTVGHPYFAPRDCELHLHVSHPSALVIKVLIVDDVIVVAIKCKNGTSKGVNLCQQKKRDVQVQTCHSVSRDLKTEVAVP